MISNPLEEKIEKKECIVGIIGLGYVGLPLSLCFLSKNIKVYGFDLDKAKINDLNRGKSFLKDISNDEICEYREKDLLKCFSDFKHIKECDVVIICVPTPLTNYNEPDLSYIISACESIAQYLQPYTLVVLESTSWPGTTDEIVKPILESNNNIKVGKNLFLCFSPEREDPGNNKYKTRDIPKIVGGSNLESLEIGKKLYSLGFNKIIPVSSNKVAEAVKLYENIFRSVNIALANESKIIFDKMGIDVWEVIQAASTKPFGFMPFWPGPGLGGHCIPVDPFYLSWKAKEFNIKMALIEVAGEIHKKMPFWVVQKIQDSLNENLKPLKNSKILIIGITYKPNVADIRESPALEIMKELKSKGAEVDFFDPIMPIIPETIKYKDFKGKKSIEPSSEFDCFVILSPHSIFDAEYFLSFNVIIVDTRNFLPKKDRVFAG